MRKGVFTTAAVDNIDHNPTATTSKSSFHGTSISLFQHAASSGTQQEKLVTQTIVKKISNLPETYTDVKLCGIMKKTPPPNDIPVPELPQLVKVFMSPQFEWLENVSLTEKLSDTVKVTWASHDANHNFEIGISSLMPLLRDKANDIATIKHVMDRVKVSLQFLNPSQSPVITADQPLFTLAKQIQWSDPNVIILRGLHTEMATLKVIGNVLKNSG